MKDKVERKLKKVIINLMREPKFADMSGILMLGSKRIDDNMPTAATDGRDEIYGRKFIEQLSEKELGFVVLHESFHKMFRHLQVWRKLWDKNQMAANAACDFVINILLKDRDPGEEHIAMPKIDGKVCGLVDERFRGMNAKQVFDILMKEAKKCPSCGGTGKKQPEGDEKGDGQGEGQPGEEKCDTCQGSGQGKPGKGGEGFDEHDWAGAKELSKEERDKLERDIDQAIRQGQIAAQKACGNGAGGMDRSIAELLEPKVDWREELREFTTSVCAAKDMSSWRRVNRRYIAQDIYLPTLIGERVGHIVLGVDTSGSIGQEELTAALTETMSVINMVRPERITLVYWDAAVAGVEEYDSSSMDGLVQSTKPKGGGGTDPTCMLKWMKDNKIECECVIQFTDGCIGDWGDDWGVPIMWVVMGEYGRNTYAPCGKTIHLSDD